MTGTVPKFFRMLRISTEAMRFPPKSSVLGGMRQVLAPAACRDKDQAYRFTCAGGVLAVRIPSGMASP